MITASALYARATALEYGPFFLAGEASELAFQIAGHPAMSTHIATTGARGTIFNALYRALHCGDRNAAETLVEQVFPGFSCSTVTRYEVDCAGIIPDESDELRGEYLAEHYPAAQWAEGGLAHADVSLPRWPGDFGQARVSIAVVLAVLHALELKQALAS